MNSIRESVIETKRWEDYDTIVCPNGQIIDMVDLLDQQARARVALAHLEPFLGSLMSKLRPVYTFRVKTQATDGVNIFINPQFTANLDFEGKVFVLAHELWHCVLDHMRRGRQAGHDHRKSNIAADHEVNNTLVNLDFMKESTIRKCRALLDRKYSEWSYEKIYADNPPDPAKGRQNNSKDADKAQQNQGQGSGQGGNQGSGSGQGGNQNQKRSPEYVDGWNRAISDYRAGKIKL